MKRGQLIASTIVAVLLLIAWLSLGSSTSSVQSGSNKGLAGVSADEIKALIVEKGAAVVKLQLMDRTWAVSDKGSFPADANKIRSLLLKLYDLGSSQSMPSSDEAFKKLGVAENSIEEGFSKVKIFGKDNSAPAAEVFLGRIRQNADGGPGGQYVRLGGSKQVLLINSPIELDADAVAWLETEVLNVRQSTVYKIEQFAIDANGIESPVFEFSRGLLENGGWGELRPVSLAAESVNYEESVLSQIKGALENVRLKDVEVVDQEPVKGFDAKTVFKLNTGIAYTILSKQEGDKYYGAVSVSRPSRLIDELKELANKSKQLKESSKALEEVKTDSLDSDKETPEKEDPDKEGTEKENTDKANTDEETPDKAQKTFIPLVKLATEPEATALNERFSKWTYELAEFQAKKFRFSKEDLLRKETPPTE